MKRRQGSQNFCDMDTNLESFNESKEHDEVIYEELPGQLEQENTFHQYYFVNKAVNI